MIDWIVCAAAYLIAGIVVSYWGSRVLSLLEEIRDSLEFAFEDGGDDEGEPVPEVEEPKPIRAIGRKA